MSDVAYKKAVMHLYELGYSVEEIEKKSTYPVTKEQIANCILEYQKKQESKENAFRFVEETDAYGRKTFRRVRKEEERYD